MQRFVSTLQVRPVLVRTPGMTLFWGLALLLGCVTLGLLRQGPFASEAIWNPAAGLSLVFLVAAGGRCWPFVFLALLAGALMGPDAAVPLWTTVVRSAAATAAYAWMALLVRPHRALESIRMLAAFARIVVPGTLFLCLVLGIWHGWMSLASARVLATVTLHDWLSELNGILFVAPALLIHREEKPWTWRPGLPSILEALAQMAAIGTVLWVVFTIAAAYNVRFFSLIFLPLIWVVVRWGLPGTTLALLSLQVGIAISASVHPATSPLQLQLLSFALCATGLTLGVVVTQRKHIEARLQEKQAALNQALQLASAGEMTAALAHELSQPVAALSRYLGACEVLVQQKESAALLGETLRKATAEAARASEVVHRLRDFYRRGAVQVEPVDPMSLVQSAARSVQLRAQRAGIKLSLQAASPLPHVVVDVLQVETALLNVFNNAIDALIEAPDPRTIEVQAGMSPLGVGIRVTDSGPGVDPQVAERLFQPFNTNKPAGMGMGLAICRALLVASGGNIVHSEAVGSGASFLVILPTSREVPPHG